MGFDQRPIARPYIQIGSGGLAPYDPVDVARKYNFPMDVTGRGQTIALIELGGSSANTDLTSYFKAKKIYRRGTLRTEIVKVDGAAEPIDVSHGVEEVQLDIAIAGSIAPGADIVVYFAPNSGNGLRTALETAFRDPATSVVSISWGGAEPRWTAGDRDAINQVIVGAASTATVCVASGDFGSSDRSGPKDEVDRDNPLTDFPASCPNVLACGGTTLPRVGEEIGWHKGKLASGGGFSSHFKVPPFQGGFHFSLMRGVPDVSANADLETGYNVRINGVDVVRGGTSAAAPLWAGLIALINEKLGTRVGFINDRLYRNSESVFKDIVDGDKGRWNAARGWDPVTGLGSPIGDKIIEALR